MNNTVLQLRNLSVAFPTENGRVDAVQNVTFDLDRGETLALVGESGSGKSVTANAVLQIVDRPGRVTGGTILLRSGGERWSISDLPANGPAMRRIRARYISMVFQEPMSALSPVHTCGRQILEKLLLAEPDLSIRSAQRRMADVFERVELPNPERMSKRYPFELSGGQRQRVVIAMAIASAPQVLIADEPTTSLDVVTQARILALLNELQSEMDMAMLFVTHDMSVVAQLADRVLVMRNGATVEEGLTHQVFRCPQHEYTAELIGATQRLERASPLKLPVAPEGTPILEVQRLSKSFAIKRGIFQRPALIHALKEVSLALHPGESLGVVGESGSGKSTLARCLLGLTTASAGQMLFRPEEGTERDLIRSPPVSGDTVYLNMRMIFQDPWSSLNPQMNIFRIVAEPLRLLRRDLEDKQIRRRVASTLRRVGIDASMLNRYPHAFSGGQRQRIVIARAIITEPRILLADEATAALDISLRAQILDLLLGIQRDTGVAIILITHDIATVRYVCDRVIVMRSGSVVESGLMSDVLDDPQAAYTRALIRSVPRPNPEIAQGVFATRGSKQNAQSEFSVHGHS